MTRALLNVLTALSLLLCAVVCAVWVRSYSRYAEVQWGKGLAWYVYEHSLVASDGSTYYTRSYPSLVRMGPGGLPIADTYERMGFLFVRGTEALVPPVAMEASDTGVYHYVVGVPLWSLALASAVLPVARLTRRSRFSQPGTCRSCGYDLRATPDRCPECGHRPRNVTS